MHTIRQAGYKRAIARPTYLDLRLLSHRSGEADLRCVVSSYCVGEGTYCLVRLDYRDAVLDNKIVGAWHSFVEHFGMRGAVTDTWEQATSTVDYR